MTNLRFDQFASGGAIQPNDITVGLRSSLNYQFSANTFTDLKQGRNLQPCYATENLGAGDVLVATGYDTVSGFIKVARLSATTDTPIGIIPNGTTISSGATGYFLKFGYLTLSLSGSPSIGSFLYVQASGALSTTVTGLLVGKVLYNTTGTNYVVCVDFVGQNTTTTLQVLNNLSDLTNVAAARTNLGLGSMAVQDANNVSITGGFIDGTDIGVFVPADGFFLTAHVNDIIQKRYYLQAKNTSGSSIPTGVVVTPLGDDAADNIPAVQALTSPGVQYPIGINEGGPVSNGVVADFLYRGRLSLTLAETISSFPTTLYVQNDGTLGTGLTGTRAGSALANISGSVYAVYIDFDSVASSSLLPSVTTVSTSTYTLQASDNGNFLHLTYSGNVTLTLPQTSTAALPAGFNVTVVAGNGEGNTVTVVKEGTDTIQGTTRLYGGETAEIFKIVAGSPNKWQVGDSVLNGYLSLPNASSTTLSTPLYAEYLYSGTQDTVITLPALTSESYLLIGASFYIKNNSEYIVDIKTSGGSYAVSALGPQNVAKLTLLDNTGFLGVDIIPDSRREFLEVYNGGSTAAKGKVMAATGYFSSGDDVQVGILSTPGVQIPLGIVIQASLGSGFSTSCLMKRGDFAFDLGSVGIAAGTDLYVNSSGSLTTTQTAQYAGKVLSFVSGTTYQCYIDFNSKGGAATPSGVTILTNQSNTVTLTNPPSQYYSITYGTSPGTPVVKLPAANATGAMPLGAHFQIYNPGTVPFDIQDNSGGVLGTLYTSMYAKIVLLTNTTAAGTYNIFIEGTLAQENFDNVEVTNLYVDGYLSHGFNSSISGVFPAIIAGNNCTVTSSNLTNGNACLGASGGSITGNSASCVIMGTTVSSTINDGQSNIICCISGGSASNSGVSTWVGGKYAVTATHSGNFIWNGRASTSYTSLANYQVVLLADNGVVMSNPTPNSSNMPNSSMMFGYNGTNIVVVNKTSDGTVSTINIVETIGKQGVSLIDRAYPSITSGATIAQVESSTNKNNYRGWSFAASGNSYLHIRFPMPKNWDQGTVTFMYIWKTSGTSGNVVWSVQGVGRVNGGAEDAAFGTAVTLTSSAAGSAQAEIITAETSAMTFAGTLTYPCEVEIRINRNGGSGSDTLASAAVLIGVRMFYITNASNEA